jgi:6-phosphogluconolactonase/glucosamine-6-phosphate isomerase/deaminase
MELIVCKGEQEFTRSINQWCEMASCQGDSMFIPSGESPKPLYEDWNRVRPPWLNKLRLVQLDEVLQPEEPFKAFFKKFLSRENISWVKESPFAADLAILGLGWNGHVAFHEPHVDPDFEFGEVELSPGTCERNNIPLGSKGLTFGLGAFLKTKRILMIVRGPSKREVLAQLLAGEASLPASKLLRHHHFTIIAMSDCVH